MLLSFFNRKIESAAKDQPGGAYIAKGKQLSDIQQQFRL
jgi:hypothetical protein